MANEPLIGEQDRPDLTVDMEGKVGDLTVRELAVILGLDPESELEGKETSKEQSKDHKDQKDHKDSKDQKDQKDQKDSKDQKDQKDGKDQKDQKDQKDTKDQKDQKDWGDSIITPKGREKDQKDQKETKELRDALVTPFRPDKPQKDQKDLTDVPSHKPSDPKGQDTGPGSVQDLGELDQLIKRVSGLEQAIEELKRAMK